MVCVWGGGGGGGGGAVEWVEKEWRGREIEGEDYGDITDPGLACR